MIYANPKSIIPADHPTVLTNKTNNIHTSKELI
jgi:hypothetical protein